MSRSFRLQCSVSLVSRSANRRPLVLMCDLRAVGLLCLTYWHGGRSPLNLASKSIYIRRRKRRRCATGAYQRPPVRRRFLLSRHRTSAISSVRRRASASHPAIRGNSWRTGYWRGQGTPRARRSISRQHRSAAAAEMTVLQCRRRRRRSASSFAAVPSSSKSITHPYLLAPGLNDEGRSLARSLVCVRSRFNRPRHRLVPSL